jgi:hypothetical protein
MKLTLIALCVRAALEASWLNQSVYDAERIRQEVV